MCRPFPIREDFEDKHDHLVVELCVLLQDWHFLSYFVSEIHSDTQNEWDSKTTMNFVLTYNLVIWN